MARNYGVSFNPLSDQQIAVERERLRRGTGLLESGNNYQALGPVIKRKSGTDRAYGKYGVMGANIPSWTERALGQRLTPQQFLASPEAQEAVFDQQMTQNLKKYGSAEDAASVWFSGRPLGQALRAGAHDVNMGVGQYVAKALGQPAPSRGVQVAGGDEELWRRLNEAELPGFAQKTPQQGEPQRDPLMDVPLPGYAPKSIVPIAAPTPPPSMPIPPKIGEITAPKAEDIWGPGMQFANALTFGGARPLYGAATGYSPEQISAARKVYEETSPLAAMGAEIGGGVAQGVLAAAAAPWAVPAIFESRVAQTIPLVRRAAPMVEKLMALRPGYKQYPGGGYLSKPGLAGTAERYLGGAAFGAGKGGAQAAANIQVNPDIPAAQQIGLGSALGVLGEPLSATVRNAPKPAFEPTLPGPARAAGNLARSKYGIEIAPWQLGNLPAEAEISSKILSPETAVKQVAQFSKAVGDLYAHVGEFTPKNIDTNIDRIGKDIGRAANTSIDLVGSGRSGNVRNALNLLAQQALNHVADPGDQARILKTIQNVDRTLFKRGLSGIDIQDLVMKNGAINQGLPPQSNSLWQHYNTQLQKIADYAFGGSTIPGKADAWREARSRYKLANVAKDAAVAAGYIDPKTFAEKAEKMQVKGDAAELAEIGKFMFGISEKGSPNIPPYMASPGFGQTLSEAGRAGLYTGGGFYGGTQVVNKLMELGLDPAFIGSSAGLLGGAVSFAPKGFEYGKRAVLKSPLAQSAIMKGKGGKLSQAVNILADVVPRAAVTPVPTAMEKRRKK